MNARRIMAAVCTPPAVLAATPQAAAYYYGYQEYNHLPGMTLLAALTAAIAFAATLGLVYFLPLGNKRRHVLILVGVITVDILAYLLGIDWYIAFWIPFVYLAWLLAAIWMDPMMAERKRVFVKNMTYKNPDAPMSGRIVFWSCMLLGQAVAFLGMAELGDLSQLWIQSPRELTMATFALRWPLFWTTMACLVLCAWIWRRDRLIQKRWMLVLSVLLVTNVVTWFVPGRMFQSKQHSSVFVSFEVADRQLFPHSEVTVVDINGESRAYPDTHIVQAHITGTEIAGERVAMTHCGLTHLSFAYEPVLNGNPVDLKVFTQLANNLTMYDTITDKPIQQITGKDEYSDAALKSIPSFRMTYGNYKKLYPDGKVFWYPIEPLRRDPAEHLWNSWVRWIIFMLVNKQHDNPTEPSFPTVEYTDKRLPQKEKVYALRGEEQQVVYTRRFILEHPDVATVIDGREVRLIYFPDYDAVMAFYSDGYHGPVSVRGATDDGRVLPRYEGLMAEVFWVIWAHYFPDSSINEVTIEL